MYSSSKMAIIRDANGLLAICGICKNSSRSIDPEPSLGACQQLVVSRCIRSIPIEFHEAFLQTF